MPSISALLSVAFGGAGGAVLRYLVSTILPNEGVNAFPWATFVVNILGSCLLGVMAGVWAKQNPPENPTLWLFIATGFCGGFTTFSTFSLEGLKLLQAGAITTYTLYSGATIVLGIVAVWLGYNVGQYLR